MNRLSTITVSLFLVSGQISATLQAAYFGGERVSVFASPEFFASLLYIGFVLLNFFNTEDVRIISVRNAMGGKIGVLLLFFFVWSSFVTIMHAPGDWRSIITYFGLYLLYACSYYQARYKINRIMTAIKPILILSVLSFLLSVAYLTWRGYLRLGYFGTLGDSGIQRLELGEGLRSTEIINIVSVSLLYTFFVLSAFRNTNYEKIAFLCIMIVLLVLFCYTISLGAILAISMSFFFAFQKSFRKVTKYRFVFACLVIWVVAMGIETFWVESPLEKIVTIGRDFSYKYNRFLEGESGRAPIYLALLQSIKRNLMWGTGETTVEVFMSSNLSGEWFYPHNNLLAIGYRNGVLAVLIYAMTILLALKKGLTQIFRGIKLERSTSRYYLCCLAFAITVYFQIKGLFQDTWLVKICYFWLGQMVGSASLIEGKLTKEKEKDRTGISALGRNLEEKNGS